MAEGPDGSISGMSSTKGGDSIDCYCNKKRTVGSVELQCGICQRWYHKGCVTCPVDPAVCFMTNYQFFCKLCSSTGQETFNKKQASFGQMCFTAIANLMAMEKGDPTGKLYSKDKEIIPYVDKHWEALTTTPRRVKNTWHTTVSKTLLKTMDVFTIDETDLTDLKYGLVNGHLAKIGPNYDTLKSSLLNPSSAYSSGPRESKQDKADKAEAPAKTGRGVKRKAAENANREFKEKKNRVKDDPSLPGKSPNMYPTEHPFNKDGYRYFLAEPDPHAPNRTEFEESAEWAGKPIPGYLYRRFIEPRVRLSLNDRAHQLKVHDDRLTVTGEKGYSMIRATHGVSRGNWYFETTILDLPDGAHARIGWSQALGQVQAPCGYDKFSYAIRTRKGTRFHQSFGKTYGKEFGAGDILGCYIELPTKFYPGVIPPTYKDKPLIKFKNFLYYEEKDNAAQEEKKLKSYPGLKISWYLNGKNLGQAYDGAFKGTYFPAISLYKSAVVKANFGPRFRHAPKDMDRSRWRPMSDNVELAHVEAALADVLYHIENEKSARADHDALLGMSAV